MKEKKTRKRPTNQTPPNITNIYVADFETNVSSEAITTQTTDVWLWDICSISTYTHTTGNTLTEFFNHIQNLPPSIIYFHNLKFDGQFILYHLLKHSKYTHTEAKPKPNEFTTLITEMGVFYCITINFGNTVIEIRDSLKKINGTVEEIALSYELPIIKGTIDYTINRTNPYKPTPEEIYYIHHDTEIIARVLNLQYSERMTHLTTASDTFNEYKTCIGHNFHILFPILSLEEDNYIRKSYLGGVCQVNPKYQGKDLTNIIVYDVNSMYPHKMCKSVLPYGRPKYYTGPYIANPKYPLFICHILVDCTLKPGHFPTILLKNANMTLLKQYIYDTDGEEDLYLTSVDLQLLYVHYTIHSITYIDGYMFMGSTNLFHAYLLPVYTKKCTTKGAEKQLNKLLLNGLYGKFASNPEKYNKIPYLEDDIVKYKTGAFVVDEPIYTAVSSFITAYARQQLFEAIHAHAENFVYCDTDSVHLKCKMKSEFEVDPIALGAWKEEKIYLKARYLAQKTYIGQTSSKLDKKIAGASKEIKQSLTFENFHFGFTSMGKLIPKAAKGGVILQSTEFTLKERKKSSQKTTL